MGNSTCTEGRTGEDREDRHSQAKDRGLRRNQPCPHLDCGLPAQDCEERVYHIRYGGTNTQRQWVLGEHKPWVHRIQDSLSPCPLGCSPWPPSCASRLLFPLPTTYSSHIPSWLLLFPLLCLCLLTGLCRILNQSLPPKTVCAALLIDVYSFSQLECKVHEGRNLSVSFTDTCLAPELC